MEKRSGTVKGSAHQIGRLGAHCTNLKHWKVREEKILWKMYRIRGCVTVFWAVGPCTVLAQVVDATLASTSNPRMSLRI